MAIVTINVDAYIDPGVYNPIELAFYPSDQVCYRVKDSYQIDTEEFEAGSLIYNEDDSPAAIGWYSDGHNRAQWNGSAIIAFQPCQVDWQGSEPYCIVNEIELEPFDHMVVNFSYVKPEDGTDLDLMVYYSGTGTAYDNNAVGFGQTPDAVKIPTDATADADAYLWWANDDVSSPPGPCVEAVVIGVNNFVDNETVVGDDVTIVLRAGWYNSAVDGDGDVIVTLKTYLGGTMSKVGTDIINTGGTLIDNESRPVVVTRMTPGQVTEANSNLLGTVVYNKVTKTAILTT